MPADLEGTTKTFLWTLRIPRTATQAGCCSQRAPGAEEAQNEELGECMLQTEEKILLRQSWTELSNMAASISRGAEKACINSSVERGYEGTAASSWSSTARWPYSTDRTQR
ncbi:uncharacterized protein AB9X84_007504 isoform 6-T15 [Acanthopagrus schlegelii]